MLIIALVLAVIGLAALVTAVVTSNELIAWVCIGASVLGVVLLIVDALRERARGAAGGDPDADAGEQPESAYSDSDEPVDYPEDAEVTEAAEAVESEDADESDAEVTEAVEAVESEDADESDAGESDADDTVEETVDEKN